MCISAVAIASRLLAVVVAPHLARFNVSADVAEAQDDGDALALGQVDLHAAQPRAQRRVRRKVVAPVRAELRSHVQRKCDRVRCSSDDERVGSVAYGQEEPIVGEEATDEA